MKYQMYITLAGENEIAAFSIHDFGKPTLQFKKTIPGKPAPLVIDKNKKFLYVGCRDSLQLTTLLRTEKSGELEILSSTNLPSDPCYLSLDKKNNFIFSAYYGAGIITVHSINQDGSINQKLIESIVTAKGSHCIQSNHSNNYVFSTAIAETKDHGSDNSIFQFIFNQTTGQLIPNTQTYRLTESNPLGPRPLGPRHFCFHPQKNDFVYFSNEQGSSVSVAQINQKTGTLKYLQHISTLPENYTQENTCSQIHITSNGKFLFAPNRGHNSIASFSIDQNSGLLNKINYTIVDPVPRAFNLDPSGEYLYVTGLTTGNLLTYKINSNNGTLDLKYKTKVGQSPMWVMIINPN